MNPFGSYKALLANSISALASAIEIYNKPRIDYRDECAVILLVNAWELVLKATLSKNRVRIYYPKKRNQPYRTYSLSDSLNKASRFFPSSLEFDATAKNIELLVQYRDNAVHFYNSPGFGVLVYGLAQTAITNFRDYVKRVFDRDIPDEFTLAILPLALTTPKDPIQFLRDTQSAGTTSTPVREFTDTIRNLVFELDDAGKDTGRLLTVFSAALVSTKKVKRSDLTVGVGSSGSSAAPLLVHKRVDPNKTHPYRESDIISRSDGSDNGLGIQIDGVPLTQYPFRAIGYHLKVKEQPDLYWADQTGAVSRYSEKYINVLRGLEKKDLDGALKAYRSRSD